MFYEIQLLKRCLASVYWSASWFIKSVIPASPISHSLSIIDPYEESKSLSTTNNSPKLLIPTFLGKGVRSPNYNLLKSLIMIADSKRC